MKVPIDSYSVIDLDAPTLPAEEVVVNARCAGGFGAVIATDGTCTVHGKGTVRRIATTGRAVLVERLQPDVANHTGFKKWVNA